MGDEKDMGFKLPPVVRGGGRRLAIVPSDWIDDWWVPWSPRNSNNNAEGSWADWVELANEILRIEAEREIAALKGSTKP